tara:strand:+ start:1322 stop:1681 length:360 start_codon:yes stop_codon:yes gene_type:complete
MSLRAYLVVDSVPSRSIQPWQEPFWRSDGSPKEIFEITPNSKIVNVAILIVADHSGRGDSPTSEVYLYTEEESGHNCNGSRKYRNKEQFHKTLIITQRREADICMLLKGKEGNICTSRS